jgi:FkbM family methyltransferase
MKNYSQNREQEHILRIFGGFVGRFLEIGACDGLLVSNTMALVERGWRGVMIEPSPRAFLSLVARHGKNPRLTLVHAAIGTRLSLSPFWDSPVAEGYATTETSNRDKWKHLAKFGDPFYLPLVPIGMVLDAFPGPVDFLNIDTEGTSVDLFLEYPFSRTPPPRVVCVEHDGRIGECTAHAKTLGYEEVDRNAENLIFVLQRRS